MSDVPLTTLASWAWIAFTMEIDNAFEAATSEELSSYFPEHGGRYFRVSIPMWANGLRLVDDEGITVDDLWARAGAVVNLGGLERWGYVHVGDAGGKRKGYGTNSGYQGTTALRPTPAGAFARRTWPAVVAATEQRQRVRFGADLFDALARTVGLAIAGADQPLPWAPPEVSPKDGFRTRVVVTPQGPSTDDDMPLICLLGQLVTRLTLDFEREGDVSLAVAANLLRVVDVGARVRDLPRLSGLSKEATAMGVALLQRRGLATVATDKSISLTPAGRSSLDSYRARVGALDEPTIRGQLEELLGQREALAAGLVPPDGCWRGQKPYRTQTEAILADPTAALPWQPMVLHRGGWPDGS